MRQVQSDEGEEPDGNGKQDKHIRQHDHLADEFLFWCGMHPPSRARTMAKAMAGQPPRLSGRPPKLTRLAKTAGTWGINDLIADRGPAQPPAPALYRTRLQRREDFYPA